MSLSLDMKIKFVTILRSVTLRNMSYSTCGLNNNKNLIVLLNEKSKAQTHTQTRQTYG